MPAFLFRTDPLHVYSIYRCVLALFLQFPVHIVALVLFVSRLSEPGPGLEGLASSPPPKVSEHSFFPLSYAQDFSARVHGQ